MKPRMSVARCCCQPSLVGAIYGTDIYGRQLPPHPSLIAFKSLNGNLLWHFAPTTTSSASGIYLRNDKCWVYGKKLANFNAPRFMWILDAGNGSQLVEQELSTESKTSGNLSSGFMEPSGTGYFAVPAAVVDSTDVYKVYLFDEAGNFVWRAKYDGDGLVPEPDVRDCTVTSDAVWVTGTRRAFGGLGVDTVTKYDITNGNELLTADMTNTGVSIHALQNGNIAVADFGTGTAFNRSTLFVFSPEGAELFRIETDPPFRSAQRSMSPDADSNIYNAGDIPGGVPIIKYSPSLVEIWRRPQPLPQQPVPVFEHLAVSGDGFAYGNAGLTVWRVPTDAGDPADIVLEGIDPNDIETEPGRAAWLP